MAREFLMLVRETSYGVPDLDSGKPKAGSFAYIRLDEDNTFTVREEPQLVAIPYGGGLDIDALDVNDYNACRGGLSVKLCYSQAALLLGWGITRINAGRTTPWPTTDAGGIMPPGDLASASIYHAKMRSDGTLKRTRYAGCKVAGGQFDGSRQSQVFTLSLNLIAQKAIGNAKDAGSLDPDATEFPAPQDSDFARDLVLFSHTDGGLKLGSIRTLYESISLSWQNKLAEGAMEKHHLSYLFWTGRETNLTSRGLYKATPDDRAAYEGRTAHDVELGLTNGAKTIAFDMHTQGRISQFTEDLSAGDAYKQELTVKVFHDPSADNPDQPDLAVAVTDNPGP